MSLWLCLAFAAVAGAAPRGAVHPSDWPALVPAPALDPRVESFVGRLLARMTLEEKVGQLVQADIASITPDDLRRYRLGAVLAGGNSAPGADLRAPASEWLALTDA